MRHPESRRRAGSLSLLCALVAPAMLAITARGVFAQGVEYVKANYTKYEYRIPMRDGKRLFTAVYAPKEQSHPWPIILVRTPYSVGPYGADHYRSELWPSALFAKAGYIFAYQDVRGRWMSEGEFVNMRPQRRALTPGPSAKMDNETGTQLVSQLTQKSGLRPSLKGLTPAALSRGRGRLGSLLLNPVHGGVVKQPGAAGAAPAVAAPA